MILKDECKINHPWKLIFNKYLNTTKLTILIYMNIVWIRLKMYFSRFTDLNSSAQFSVAHLKLTKCNLTRQMSGALVAQMFKFQRCFWIWVSDFPNSVLTKLFFCFVNDWKFCIWKWPAECERLDISFNLYMSPFSICISKRPVKLKVIKLWI